MFLLLCLWHVRQGDSDSRDHPACSVWETPVGCGSQSRVAAAILEKWKGSLWFLFKPTPRKHVVNSNQLTYPSMLQPGNGLATL